MVTPTRCPAVNVPAVTPCDPEELRPLLAWLTRGEQAEDVMRFPRGAVLPDGRLDLCKQSIGPDGARLVLDALRGTRAVRTILFGTGAIGNTGARAVAEALDDGLALDTVYLGCNRIDAEGASVLAAAVARSGVRALWLKRNPLGADGACPLAELIAGGAELTVLDLYNCELGDEGVATIARALASPRSRVEHVYLGGNASGRVAADAIAELLASPTRLRSLQLSASRFAGLGAILARGLASGQPTLEELGLACCQLDHADGAAIATAAIDHPRLLQLDLGWAPSANALGEAPNRLTDASAPAVAELVRANGPLRVLDVRRTGITSRGASSILEAVQANTQLVRLGLNDHVARTIRRSLRRTLDANAAAHHLPGMPAHVAEIQSVYRTKR
jgi:hypothetical protein